MVPVSVSVSVDDTSVEVTFRVLTSPVLAGGPLEVECVVANRGDDPVPVPMGTDRMKRRARPLRFAGRIDDLGLELTDPWERMVDRGGIGGNVPLGPDAEPLRQTVLVNDFLTLEELRRSLAPSGSAVLRLGCVRQLSDQTEAEAELEIHVVRDDDALIALGEGLLAELSTSPPTTVEERERSIARLASIGLREVPSYLQLLEQQSDAHLAGLARDALGRLELRARQS